MFLSRFIVEISLHEFLSKFRVDELIEQFMQVKVPTKTFLIKKHSRFMSIEYNPMG